MNRFLFLRTNQCTPFLNKTTSVMILSFCCYFGLMAMLMLSFNPISIWHGWINCHGLVKSSFSTNTVKYSGIYDRYDYHKVIKHYNIVSWCFMWGEYLKKWCLGTKMLTINLCEIRIIHLREYVYVVAFCHRRGLLLPSHLPFSKSLGYLGHQVRSISSPRHR